MAKIHEEIIVIKVSKLLKDTDPEIVIMGPETVSSLEAVVQELAGTNALVEMAIEK